MKQKKTIWIINQYASPLKYSHFGARHIFFAKEFIKAGYQVYIISSTYNHYIHTSPPEKNLFNMEEIEGVNMIWVKGFKYKNSNGLGRIISWILFSVKLFILPWKKLGNPEIILISSMSIIPIINAIWLKRKFKIKKLILEIRDIWPLTFIEIGKRSKYHPLALLLGFFEKLAYKKADHIVATMPKADLHISKKTNKKFNYSFIPQGINESFFAQQKELEKNFIDKYIPLNKFIVCYAGTIGKSNALITLIEAAKQMDNIHKDIHFILLGDGHDKMELINNTIDLKNITFVPKVNSYYVQSFLKHCNLLYDSVLSVPLYNFGISRNKWMDYLYSNKPIIVSFSGYDKLLDETKSGIIIPAENTNELIKSILFIKNMKEEQLGKMKNGRDYILKNRTYPILSKQFLNIFE
jgi:glycosyltransferase involved in cell wall biosynthesis